MTTLHPLALALAGYFLCLYEYIAMRHRVICAESDARMILSMEVSLNTADLLDDVIEVSTAIRLYWDRGTK